MSTFFGAAGSVLPSGVVLLLVFFGPLTWYRRDAILDFWCETFQRGAR